MLPRAGPRQSQAVRHVSLTALDGKAALAVDFFPRSSVIAFACADGQVLQSDFVVVSPSRGTVRLQLLECNACVRRYGFGTARAGAARSR
jgi:hypothetical protein